MIVTEEYATREDGVLLVRTYSDAGFKILQRETGDLYIDAVDVSPLRYTYQETNISIETKGVEGETEDFEQGPEPESEN